MSGKARLHALMTEIGPLLELGEVAAFDSEDLWTLALDGDTVVFADLDQAQERLWLSAEIGPAPDGDRAALFETLLAYNHLWRDTGGLRVSLDATGPGAALVLAYDLPTAALELSHLRLVLANFVDALRAWREGLGRVGSGAAPSSLADGRFDPLLAGSIRA